MRLNITKQGLELIREAGDKALSHESTVTHHIRRLLNQRGESKWVRCWPNKISLTDCRQGVLCRSKQIIYWHERYSLEAAHQAFNSGKVFFSISLPQPDFLPRWKPRPDGHSVF